MVELEGVDPRAASQRVLASAADEGIIAAAAVERVVTGAAGEIVVARVAEQVVISQAANQPFDAGKGVAGGVAPADRARSRVVERPRCTRRVAVIGQMDRDGPNAAAIVHDVGSSSAGDGVGMRASGDHVAASSPGEGVVPGSVCRHNMNGERVRRCSVTVLVYRRHCECQVLILRQDVMC